MFCPIRLAVGRLAFYQLTSVRIRDGAPVFAGVAQRIERFLAKEEVVSSILTVRSSLLFCGYSSVGRASPFQGDCREFDSRCPLQRYGSLGQRLSHLTVYEVIRGSIPLRVASYTPVAKWTRRRASNAEIVGSNPTWGAILEF